VIKVDELSLQLTAKLISLAAIDHIYQQIMRGSRGYLNNRGATSQVGVILMVGVVIIGIFSIIGFGVSALTDTTGDVSDETAERDLVSLAEVIDRQAIRQDSGLGTRESGLGVRQLSSNSVSVQARESAGQLQIQVNGMTIVDDTMGAIEYGNPSSDTRIAYQAGMVFTKERGEPAAVRRNNEFQYRDDGTGVGMTLHFISIDEFSSLGQTPGISLRAADNRWPDVAVGAGDTITIKISSDYDHGWVQKFNQMLPSSRTSITHNTDVSEVTVTYTAPGGGAFLHVYKYDITVGS